MTPHVSLPASWSAADADEVLRRLLQATLRQESLITARDAEIAAIQVKYSLDLAAGSAVINQAESSLEEYYGAHRAEIEKDGKKALQLTHGLIGMRTGSNPSLVPIDERWTWPKIEKKLRTLFKTRFFHAPKRPAPDKVKIKREMSAEEMAKCGLRLDDSETFYCELNRLAAADGRLAA